MENEFTEKSIYNIIIFIYLLIGFLYLFKDRVIPQRYIVLIAFFTFKLIFNYRKCTFSYLECKIRNVKKEDGVLASLMDHIVDLRYTKLKYVLYIISALFIMNSENVKDKLKF